jgi:hypothetical protein
MLAGNEAEDRRWIDNIIVTATTRERIARTLTAAYEKAGPVRGLDRFMRASGTTLFEVLTDPATGAIVEENVADNGQLQVHTVYEYTAVEPGVLVKTTTRTEVASPTPGGARTTIVSTLKNVRLGLVQKGGAQ